jgi:3-ketosteroid 9alpha-monooxygenase subunit B
MNKVATASRTIHALTIEKIVDETMDAKSLTFSVPTEARAAFTYHPGQFLTLRVPSAETGSVARCYSLSSSPHVDSSLAVAVKRTAGGYGSNWLCDNAIEGMHLDVLPPSGVFTPRSLDRDVMLIAGGSGITPLISIAKSVLAAGTGNVALFYANRDAASVIFTDQLAQLVSKYQGRLSVYHWLESERGIPTASRLATEFAATATDRDVFVCGPGPFKEASVAGLRALGVDKSLINQEIFSSLKGNPFTAEAVLDDDAPGSIAAVSAQVEIDGETHNVDWPVDTPLIQCLIDRGIAAPFSCQEGECGTCLATISRGKVRMLTNFVLDEEDIASGSILACQALPDSEGLIRVSFDE